MSDLSKYCVRIGERSSKRRFPHFKLCCIYAYRAVMAVGVGILYNFPILYYWQSTYVFDLYPQSLRLSRGSW